MIAAEVGNSYQVTLVDQHEPCLRVGDLMTQDAAEVFGVHRHLDRPHERQPQPRIDKLDRIVEHHEHRFAALHALVHEQLRGAACPRP